MASIVKIGNFVTVTVKIEMGWLTFCIPIWAFTFDQDGAPEKISRPAKGMWFSRPVKGIARLVK